MFLSLLLVLPAVVPAPQPEVRLFSDSWGASSWMDPDFCLTPIENQLPRLALFPKLPAVADAIDRLALALRYLAWGLLLPLLALVAVLHPRGGSCRPALLIFGAFGFAPAWFQWTLNPAFVELRQALADAWLARWPLAESQFVWLDGVALSIWLVGGTLLAGGASFVATWLAARLAGIDWRRLATALVPLAGVVIFLGLTQETALYLRGEGANLDWLPGFRGALLAIAISWSVWRGVDSVWKLSRGRTPIRMLALMPYSLPLALVAAHGWAMYFHWTGRYHV